MRLFAFKRALYIISSKLTDSDVDKMKFMLSDFLPRQQLEKSRSGFDLLCLMASRSDLLSCDNYSFLEEVLREVGKGYGVLSSVLASYTSCGMLNTLSVVDNGSIPSGVTHQTRKLVQLKRFLGDMADNMTAENVHDLCQFFAGICESINYQNLQTIKSGEQLFSRLLDSQLIGVGQLQPLQEVLSIIGRLDLASNIETFKNGIWQSANQSTPDEQRDHHGPRGFTYESSSITRTESLPEEEQSYQERARGFASYISPSVVDVSRKMDSLDETDSGSANLLLKIEDQEKLLNQQEVELNAVRGQLEVKGDSEGMERQLMSDLKQKTAEVKLLHGNIIKLQELLWKKSDIPLYEMNQSPHGLAVIITNGNFEVDLQNPSAVALRSRKGALKDADCFSQTFTFLQYEVQLHSDMTADNMRSIILEISNADHSRYDSFVCCVSSHGNQDGVYGTDGVALQRKAFVDPIKFCASLREKPKMFFFQACRVPVVSVDSGESDITGALMTTIHSDTDVLIANASTEGNPAYTSLMTGSWFANAIHRKLTDPQLVYVRTLQQLLEEVTDVVSQAAGQLTNGEQVAQCVDVTTRMRKGVKFLK